MKKATYIQFEIPNSEEQPKVDGVTKQTLKKIIIGVLSTIIPKANPDFDNKIDFVKSWLLELNSDTGIPEREIGLDKSGLVILKMPFKNNYGYWIDNNLLLKDFKEHFKTSEINNSDFEKYWNSFDLVNDKNSTIKQNKNVG